MLRRKYRKIYNTFSTNKKKIENKNIEITYKLKFIDSYKFMSMPLSKLVDNLLEEVHNNKCAHCKSCLDYVRSTKNEKLILKCFNCETYYRKKINKELINDLLVRMNFVIKTLINISYY